MTIDAQLEMFQAQATWLRAEKTRLLAIIRRRRGPAQEAAWLALLEISDRHAQLNREFETFLTLS